MFPAGYKPPGRPEGSKNKKTQIEELLTAPSINKRFKERFDAGDEWVERFAFEHFYGKPVQENNNNNRYPDGVGMKLIIGD